MTNVRETKIIDQERKAQTVNFVLKSGHGVVDKMEMICKLVYIF